MAARTDPPDRLALVLDEVDRARQECWLPEDPQDKRRPWERTRASAPVGQPPVDDAAGDTDVDTEPQSRPTSRRERRRDPELGARTGFRPSTPLTVPRRSLSQIVVAPGRAAVLGLVVMLVVVALVLGGRLAWMRATSTPEEIAAPTRPAVAASEGNRGDDPAGGPGSGIAASPDQAPQRTGAAAAGAVPTSASGRPATSGPVYVHVVGQVKRPGVVTLPAGARVRDALTAAGGPSPGADLAAVNLARPVIDGEKVQVPKPGEAMSTAPTPPPQPGGAASGATPGSNGAGAGAPANGAAAPVDLNTADVAGLDALPGIGPVLAQRIIDFRTENGPFRSVDDLGEVSGIGDRVLERLRPLVTV